MDRLRLMRSLVTVVRKKSFAAASRELGVAQGLLSKHVKQLENTLNMQILLRDTHGLSLTERGREYYEFCVQFLDELEQAEEALTGRDRQPPEP
jgi:DNA-binding transcriptional LysR family regulator